MGIGSRLRETRESLRLSQEQFAEFGGVKKLAQYNYEKGERIPDAEYLAKLASALPIDALYILTGVKQENAAMTNIEIGMLQALRKMETKEQRALYRAAITLSGEFPGDN